MIDPLSFQLNQKIFPGGLFESFYYRGNDAAGELSFWLKHNFLKYHNDPMVTVESTMILFDRLANKTTQIQKSRTFAQEEFLALTENKNWSGLQVDLGEGCFFSLAPERLTGQLRGGAGEIRWDFVVNYSHIPYYHFDRDWLYNCRTFPKKKLLTRDILVHFFGTVSSNELDIATQFIGMNGHNWGKEHAYCYSYANCNQFELSGEPDQGITYFDGYSGKIQLFGGKLISPYLSGASLFWNQEWYHFNALLTTFRHQVAELTAKSWAITFCNPEYQLKVEIQGENGLWAKLLYVHPDRKISEIGNTKNAVAKLSLSKRSAPSPVLIKEWTTQNMEFETLIPVLGA